MKRYDSLNYLPVVRKENTIFIPLPQALWQMAGDGNCTCTHCKGEKIAYWDTLALSADPKNETWPKDSTWTVHYPELHDKTA